MNCTICEKRFSHLSAYYRHSWTDKHVLRCQIKEFEKKIKSLEAIIQRHANADNRDKFEIQSQIMSIPVLEKCVTYA